MTFSKTDRSTQLKQGIKFFNSGKEGNWKNVLSKEILLGIEKKFEREMKELEYI